MSAGIPFSTSVSAADLPPPRAYGSDRADLDLEFDAMDRPALVNAVLARCCAASPEHSDEERANAAWSLPLGARISRLLRVVALTDQSPALLPALRCPRVDCRESFEVNLPFADLFAQAEAARPAGNIVEFPREGTMPIALRLPTGQDQAKWLRQAYESQRNALETIVRTLVVPPHAPSPASSEAGYKNPPAVARPGTGGIKPGTSESNLLELPPGEHLDALATAMAEADPLVAFHVTTTCPQCGQHADLPVDLEAVALERLAACRREILRDVHALATRYGWTEAEVLALPARRRSEYRRLIADEEDTLP